MTDTEAGYGTAKTRDDEWIRVEPSCIDTGGVYMHVSDDDLWLTEEQVKELLKLIKEARKVVL